MSVSDRKSELRAHLLKRRNAIEYNDWVSKSKKIVAQIKGLPEFKSAKTIHCFVSMNERKEVDTHTLIKELINSKKNLVVPVTNFKTGELEHSKLTTFDELEVNEWGVLEPKNADPSAGGIDIIIVPLLAADLHFNRLGYGKGFYDRFLENEKAIKVGVLFSEFILEEIPVEDFDEKLDILISEKKTLRRNNRNLVS
ncbi:MAG TPA: 5-formyltetrahydrofolate cyclo-ligase [Balneola sp.]|jgi:5-formyltetrahydrofolate cyclo-ligase|nr:5-formyltetrahydrofolate cyclo-ligase [Bacteroidota bacterium]HCI70255.1 5-formyltetrahydrofolate cyclo-ligase [Balneola sp.]HCT51884.1 5-formyltetrahydrofolate cyclo-ligase [Balneola sp.]|tara:strand:+ start:4982 stop:5572 length:591 start_codon:yes stop_codon:yes gene_type:complete